MKTFLTVLKWVAVVLGVIFLVIFAATTRLNLGDWIERMIPAFAIRRKRAEVIPANQTILGSTVVPIAVNPSPVRNKGSVTLITGEEVALPNGIHDTDVQGIVLVKEGVYYAKASTDRLTSAFDPVPGQK